MEFETVEELLDEALKQIGEGSSLDKQISFKGKNAYKEAITKLLLDELIFKQGGETIDLTIAGIAFEGYVNQKNRFQREKNDNIYREKILRYAAVSLSILTALLAAVEILRLYFDYFSCH